MDFRSVGTEDGAANMVRYCNHRVDKVRRAACGVPRFRCETGNGELNSINVTDGEQIHPAGMDTRSAIVHFSSDCCFGRQMGGSNLLN